MHDEFPAAFSQTFQVRYDECGAGGALRAAVHLRLFQEVAFGHTAAVGVPLAWYESRGLYWVTRRVHLVVLAPVRYGETLSYETRLLGARRVMARRGYRVHRTGSGDAVATGVADWIFTRDGIAPTRIADELRAAFPRMAHAVAPSPLPEPPRPDGIPLAAVRIRAADLDGVGHMNHPVYLDLLDDAVIRAGGAEMVESHPRTYDMQYQSPVRSGDALLDAAWRDGGLWHYRLERPDGALVLHGRLGADEIPLGS
jgi:acyl-CoA thioesterase FadM